MTRASLEEHPQRAELVGHALHRAEVLGSFGLAHRLSFAASLSIDLAYHERAARCE
jgi:hypothetical protein